MANSNQGFTKNISNKVALTVYTNNPPCPLTQMKKGSVPASVATEDAFVITRGIVSVSFLRNKRGGSMEIVLQGSGYPTNLIRGSWCVLRTSNSMMDKLELETDGMVKFIGQIYAVNANYYIDQNGRKGRVVKIFVRDWSNILNAVFRYDPTYSSSLLNSSPLIQGVDSATPGIQTATKGAAPASTGGKSSPAVSSSPITFGSPGSKPPPPFAKGDAFTPGQVAFNRYVDSLAKKAFPTSPSAKDKKKSEVMGLAASFENAKDASEGKEIPGNKAPEKVQDVAAGKPAEASNMDEKGSPTQDSNLLGLQGFYSPFAFARVVLVALSTFSKNSESVAAMLGADKMTSTAEGLSKKMAVASRFPAIPKKLVEDHILTQVDFSSYDPASPLNSGFLWPIIGVQKWDKIKDGFDLKKYQGKKILDMTYSAAEGGRPDVQGTGLMNVGISIMGFIDFVCDKALYDVYSDFYHYYDKDFGRWRAAPFLVVRDKPFCTKFYQNKYADSYDKTFKWTMYDDLPVTKISGMLVTGMNLTITSLNSPNYIRVMPNNSGVMEAQGDAASVMDGTGVVATHQIMFGGKELLVRTYAPITQTTNSDSADPAVHTTFLGWFKEVKNRLVEWNTNDMYWYNGTVTIKDMDLTLSIGDNVGLDFENPDYPLIVGHLEAIEQRYVVNADGQVEQNTVLTLSRIGMTNTNYENQIVPLPIGAENNLFHITNAWASAAEYLVAAQEPLK